MTVWMLMAQFGCAKHASKSATLPTAESLFADFEEATVSEEMRDVEVRNVHMVGTMNMAMMSEPIPLDAWFIQDKGSISTTELPGMGTIIEGYNLEYAWVIDPINGDRLLEGKEMTDKVKGFNQIFTNDLSEIYTDAQTVDAVDFEGQKAWKVTAKDTINGEKVTLFFSQDESLLVGQYGSLSQNKGVLKMKTYMSDYQWMNGIYTPMTTIIKVMGLEQELVFTDYTLNNAETPDIVIPASIQAFIDENSDPEETTESEETAEPETTESDSD